MDTTFRNALHVGDRIDEFEIEAVIGHGGFGISYRARHVQSGERFALKEYLPTELATRETDGAIYPLSESHLDDFRWGLERFLDEARLLASFSHPSIVSVHRAFEDHGTAYMVMDYEEGETLAARLKRQGSLEADVLISIVMHLLDGLELVHHAGFIHRDIKPGNIYLRHDDVPVLLDFGSARQALKGKTRTLTALVSAGYAPLEQYFSRSDLQGPWTDIYGLGATLYHGISGEPPLDAVERSRGVLGSTRDILPPVAEVAKGDYPPALLAAVDHALRIEHEDRPHTVCEWRMEITGEAPVPAFPSTTVLSTVTRNTDTVVRSDITTGSTKAFMRRRRGLYMLGSLPLLATLLAWWQWPGDRLDTDPRNNTPASIAAENDSEEKISTLRRSLESAALAEQESRKRIAELTSRLEKLQAEQSENGAPASPSPKTPRDERNQSGEQTALIAELRAALAAANRERAEARRRAEELAARVKLLEAVRTTQDQDSPARRDRVDALLAAADEDLRNLRLTTPDGANAHERYAQVLELDDANARAKLGLERIVDKYIELAALADNSGNTSLASSFLDRASTVLPEHAALATARENLERVRQQDNLPTEETLRPESVVEQEQSTNTVGSGTAALETTAGVTNEGQLETLALIQPSDGETSVDLPGGRKDAAITPRSVGILPMKLLSSSHLTYTWLEFETGSELQRLLAKMQDVVIEYSAYDQNPTAVPDTTELWGTELFHPSVQEQNLQRLGVNLGVDYVVTAWLGTGRASGSEELSAWPLDLFVMRVRDGELRTFRSNSKALESTVQEIETFVRHD